MERGLEECFAIGQVVIFLSCQLVLAMFHASRRRRQRNAMILMHAARAMQRQRRAPDTRERRRTRELWEVTQFSDSLWMQHFRMSKPTFQLLCKMIGPFVGPTPSRRRPPVPMKKRIAIALYKLSTCAEYRVVAETFGVSATTAHRCLYAVCSAIRVKLLSRFVKLPDAAEAQAIAHRVSTTHLLPQVYGALDGTHIPIRAPSRGHRDYVNRNGWPSIVLQALVDDQFQIRDICVGSPGSVDDADVFTTSNLYRFPERHPQANADVEGVQVPLLIAGDPAYPLLPWLMKEFSGPNLSEEEEAFNTHLRAIRVKVEHTFAHLKARWRILAKRSDVRHSFMPTVVVACCVLHNMCEREKQRLLPSSPEPLGNPQPQPSRQCYDDQPNREAQETRDALVRHVAKRLHLAAP